jgi:hypothetical protein
MVATICSPVRTPSLAVLLGLLLYVLGAIAEDPVSFYKSVCRPWRCRSRYSAPG